MADYISREAAKNKFFVGNGFLYYGADVVDRIEEIPAADVRPVVKGKWVPYEFGDYHWHKCSVCGVADKFIETVYRKGFIDNEMISVRKFCPNCGADMRGKGTES